MAWRNMMLRRVCMTGLLVFILALATTAAAQTGRSWKVTGAMPLALQSGVGLRVFPAGNGQHIAYERTVRLNGDIELYMCAAPVTGPDDAVCLEPPQAMPRGFDADARSHFYPLSWSRDSQKIAVVGQPLLTGADTDLWVMDLNAGAWSNLSDDGYDGALGEAPAGVAVEIQPAWSPDNTQIAAARAVIDDAGQFAPAALSLIDAASGESTDLAPLPGDAPDAGSITGIAWSPDGATLAISLRQREPNPDIDGIWLADVASGELSLLVTSAAIADQFAGIFAELSPDMVGPVAWSPDGTRLLFWASNTGATPIALWAFWVDVATGDITALPLPAHPRDSGSRRGIWPLQAVWSPDGGSILVAANGTHPDDEQLPLDPNSTRGRVSVYLIDVVANESALLGHLPAGEAIPFYDATWNESGNAILNGYHLLLAQE